MFFDYWSGSKTGLWGGGCRILENLQNCTLNHSLLLISGDYTNPPQGSTSGHQAQVTSVELGLICDLASPQISRNVVHLDEIRVMDSVSTTAHQMRAFFCARKYLSHFAQLSFGFFRSHTRNSKEPLVS